MCSLGDTMRRACHFAPNGPERQTVGQGFVSRSPGPASKRMEIIRVSQVPGEPSMPMPCSRTPAGPIHQATTMNQRGPRSFNDEDSTREVISGLNGTASALAVHASQDGLLHRHARLASGCWPSSTGRDCLPAGFLRKVSVQLFTVLPPLPSFLGAVNAPISAVCIVKNSLLAV